MARVGRSVSEAGADYAALALVYAEAAGCYPAWKKALEGWNMVESQQVLEWKAEGKLEGKAEALLRILELRFTSMPAEMATRIRTTTDQQRLDRWLEAAVTATSLEDFRQAVEG